MSYSHLDNFLFLSLISCCVARDTFLLLAQETGRTDVAPKSFQTGGEQQDQQHIPVSKFSSVTEVFEFSAPWFCHGIDCPEYAVDTNFSSIPGVERRLYNATKWVSVRVKGVSYDTALYDGFMTLFKYISGANSDNVKIPMTAPVRTRLQPAAGPTCENDFEVSFFIPFDFQDGTPAPTDDRVEIVSEEPFVAFVSSYGGFSSQSSVISHAAELGAALKDAAFDIEEDFYFSAGYDPPFRIFNRHNEVWVMEKSSEKKVRGKL
mmetsp:Transcript_10501/g.24849  ORF Transcript_10501/g.24849 Transcript_10501/m.24849 type:complete len:263 (-) Transcript_10501:114-902(-)